MTRRERPWPVGTPCWADLTSSDVEGARAFYSEPLGWEVEVFGPEYGGYSLASRDGATAAGIGPTRSPDEPSAWTLHLATEDAAATAQAVRAAGGEVLLGPAQIPARGTMVVFVDPTSAVAGAWQPGPFIGAGVVNEPGALVWEDLRSPDPGVSRAFLSAVFDVRFATFDGAPGDYQTMHRDEPPLGGVGPLFGSASPHWLVYFGVADMDAAVATAAARGGRLHRPVDDTPFGRMATLRDPTGAEFALIETSGAAQPDGS